MTFARYFVVATAVHLDSDHSTSVAAAAAVVRLDFGHSMTAAAVLLDSDHSMSAAVAAAVALLGFDHSTSAAAAAAVVHLDSVHSKIGCWKWVDLDFETAVWAYFHSVVPVE